MLACLNANKPFTCAEIEKKYARMFSFDREKVQADYRAAWRNTGRMYRDTKKHVAYTGKIEDFGKR